MDFKTRNSSQKSYIFKNLGQYGSRRGVLKMVYLCMYPGHHDEPVRAQHTGSDDREGHVHGAVLPQVHCESCSCPLWCLKMYSSTDGVKGLRTLSVSSYQLKTFHLYVLTLLTQQLRVNRKGRELIKIVQTLAIDLLIFIDPSYRQ